MPIPDGITSDDVLEALKELDQGVVHAFGPPTGYELVHGGRRYPPKAAIGLAARRLLGRPLSSQEFSGGEQRNQANGRLRRLGFTVVPIGTRVPPTRRLSTPAAQAPWTIEPGTRLRRSEVHASFGGGTWGGIEPSGQTPNVLIFSEPENASVHGYAFDGWAAPDLLHYTGEGRHGDQQFSEGNSAILLHHEQRRSLRVFRASPPWATYLGEFELDPDEPFLRADSPDDDRLLRQVIVFRLRPVGSVVDGGLPAAPPVPGSQATSVVEAPPVTTSPSAIDVPPEAQNTEGYTIAPPDEPIEAVRREAALVGRYQSWLRSQGRNYARNRMLIEGEIAALYTDLFDQTNRELIEAKASASRNNVRTGLGQLLDYARYVDHDRRSVLLPSQPRRDLLELLHAHGCGCIWETTTGQFSRSDP